MPHLPDDPGAADALRPLSKLDTTALDAIVAGSADTGLVSGCACTVSGTLGIAVAAGVVRANGVRRVVTGATVTAVPDGTHPRKFVITDNGNGTPTIVHGTAAVDPDGPAVTAGHVVLRQGVLPAGLTQIATDHFAGGAVVVPEVRLLVTLGPFLFINVAASATQQGSIPYTPSSSTLQTAAQVLKQGRAGRIVGISLSSSASVSSGTAIAKARIATVVTDFAANACVLNTTNPRSFSAYDNAGLAFSANQEIGVAVVSASLSPTTLEMSAYLTVAIDPF